MFSAREDDGVTADGLGFALEDENITGAAFRVTGLEVFMSNGKTVFGSVRNLFNLIREYPSHAFSNQKLNVVFALFLGVLC